MLSAIFKYMITVFLTIVTMSSQNLFILHLEVHTFVPHLPISSSPVLTSGDYQFVPCSHQCHFFLCKIPHVSEIIQCLSSAVQLISLNAMPSRSIHVVSNGRVTFFVCLNSISLYYNTPYVFYPFIDQCI